MSIMLFANTSWYLYNFRKNLIKELLKEGHLVFACAPYDKYSEKLDELGAAYIDVDLSQRGTGLFTELTAILKIRKILHEIKPDILLTFTPKGNIYPALVKPKSVRQIANITGLGEGFDKKSILSIIVRILYKISLGSSEKVLFQNQEDMNTFIEKRIVKPKAAIRIHGSGADLIKFKPMGLKPFSEKKTCFLTLGRVIPQKGYGLILSLIEKFPEILKTVEFHILGIPDNSRKNSIELYKKLEELTEKKSVFLHDPVDEVESIINRAHCLLLPSTYNEGVPRSLIEGLACGLPIITTDWKGCRDTVIEGKNGFLVKPDSVEDLFDKINKFVKLSNEERITFSHESRDLAEKLFNEDEVISVYSDQCKNYRLDSNRNYTEALETVPVNS